MRTIARHLPGDGKEAYLIASKWFIEISGKPREKFISYSRNTGILTASGTNSAISQLDAFIQGWMAQKSSQE